MPGPANRADDGAAHGASKLRFMAGGHRSRHSRSSNLPLSDVDEPGAEEHSDGMPVHPRRRRRRRRVAGEGGGRRRRGANTTRVRTRRASCRSREAEREDFSNDAEPEYSPYSQYSRSPRPVQSTRRRLDRSASPERDRSRSTGPRPVQSTRRRLDRTASPERDRSSRSHRSLSRDRSPGCDRSPSRDRGLGRDRSHSHSRDRSPSRGRGRQDAGVRSDKVRKRKNVDEGSDQEFDDETDPNRRDFLKKKKRQEYMQFPLEYAGRVIGPKGATVEEMRKASGADIHIDKLSECCEARLTGTAEQILHARELISHAVDTAPRPEHLDEIMDVPPAMMGRIIGSGGENVIKIQADSGARVEKENPGTLRITGTDDGIKLARRLIAELIGQENDERDAEAMKRLEEPLHVAASMIGFIIGRGGETIKRLQDETGAHIDIDHDNKGHMVLSGTEKSIASCKHLILDLVAVGQRKGDEQKGRSKGKDGGGSGFGKDSGKGKHKRKGDDGFEKGSKHSDADWRHSDSFRSDRRDKSRQEDTQSGAEWADWFGMGCGKGGFPPPYWMCGFPPYWGPIDYRMHPFFDDSSSSPSPERVRKSKRHSSSTPAIKSGALAAIKAAPDAPEAIEDLTIDDIDPDEI